MSGEKFWETKSLGDMDDRQWEALCDGCARCCLIKLEDEQDGTVYYTDVACALLDLGTCRCTDYTHRQERVSSCVRLSRDRIDDLWMMPPSCAYRRIAEGRGLPDWHHLISGDNQSVLRSGWSIQNMAASETSLPEEPDWEERLAEWPVLDAPATRGR